MCRRERSEADELLARAAVVTDPDIAEWARTVPCNELCEEIMSTTATPNNLRRIDAIVNLRGDDEDDYGGQVIFNKTSTEAGLYWHPRPLSEWLEDQLRRGNDRGSHDVVNGTAAIVEFDDSDYYTALWDSDGNLLEFRSQASSLDEFRSLLDSLVVVDVDTWLAAMPASVVGAADQEAVITEMLNGIPLPGDFNPDTLADGEMNRSGNFGEVIQEFAEAMTNGGQIMQGKSTNIADSCHDALGCPE